MKPRIVILEQKRLVGKSLTMSLANNRTGELWQSFGLRIKSIKNRVSVSDRISMQIYPLAYISEFSPMTDFEKWATVEVSDFEQVPDDLQTFLLRGGHYAVFDYKGSSADPSVFQYIFYQWLPSSDYVLDDRPHFEVLGERYKNNDPESEEEIWIPIKEKN